MKPDSKAKTIISGLAGSVMTENINFDEIAKS